LKYRPDIHHRRSVRLNGYDYSQFGTYFLTLCSWNRDCLFGEIRAANMELSEYGRILAEEWQRSSTIRQEIELDKFVIMPNRIHGIVTIQDVGANGRSPETGRSAESPLQMNQKSVSSFIAGFKSVVTKSINKIRSTPGRPVWQRNYYEHIIRNDEELDRIREYIMNNPLQWAEDENNPMNFNVGAYCDTPLPDGSGEIDNFG
jgi:putative transposase